MRALIRSNYFERKSLFWAQDFLNGAHNAKLVSSAGANRSNRFNPLQSSAQPNTNLKRAAQTSHRLNESHSQVFLGLVQPKPRPQETSAQTKSSWPTSTTEFSLDSNATASQTEVVSAKAAASPTNANYPIQWTLLFASFAAITLLLLALLMRKVLRNKVISPNSSSLSSSNSSSANSYKCLLAKQRKLNKQLATDNSQLLLTVPSQTQLSRQPLASNENPFGPSKLMSPLAHSGSSLVDRSFVAMPLPPPHHSRFAWRSTERPPNGTQTEDRRMLFVGPDGHHFWAAQTTNSKQRRSRRPNSSDRNYDSGRNNTETAHHYYCDPMVGQCTEAKGAPLVCCDASSDFIIHSVAAQNSSPKVITAPKHNFADNPNKCNRTQRFSQSPEVAHEEDSQRHRAAKMPTNQPEELNEEQLSSSSLASSTRSVRSTTAQLLSSSQGASFEQPQNSDCTEIGSKDTGTCRQLHQRRSNLSSAQFWSPNRAFASNSAAQLLMNEQSAAENTSAECSPMHPPTSVAALHPSKVLTGVRANDISLSHANQSARERRNKFRAQSASRQRPSGAAEESSEDRREEDEEEEEEEEEEVDDGNDDRQLRRQRHQRRQRRRQPDKRFSIIRPQLQRADEAADKCDRCDIRDESQQHFYEEIQSSSNQQHNFS